MVKVMLCIKGGCVLYQRYRTTGHLKFEDVEEGDILRNPKIEHDHLII